MNPNERASYDELWMQVQVLEQKVVDLEQKLANAVTVAAGINVTIDEKIESLWTAIEALRKKK